MGCFGHRICFLHEIFDNRNISKKAFALTIILLFCLTVSAGDRRIVSLNSSIKRSHGNTLVSKETVRSRHDPEKAKPDSDFPGEDKKQRSMLVIFAGVLFLMGIISLIIFRRQYFLIKKNRKELAASLLHEKRMALELETTNKQLTTCTLNLLQKNDLLKAVLAQVNHVHQHSHHRLEKDFYSLKHLLEQHLHHGNNRDDVNLCFERVHDSFFKALKQKHPCLTSHDLRICALLRLNMNIKEMAALLAISPDSAKMARYRLRQKLNLPTEENLTGYIISMDHDYLPA